MSVSLEKASDTSICGGHSSGTFYTKTRAGTVPEYALSWRRREMHGVHITLDQAYELGFNHLSLLSDFFGGRL